MSNEGGGPALDRLVAQFEDVELHEPGLTVEYVVGAPASSIAPVLRYLRDDEALDFQVLTDLTVVDHGVAEQGSGRFEIVYHLHSPRKNHRLRVKAVVYEDSCAVESVVSLWPAADWLEREAWDLYGVEFLGHPDLRRIFLEEDFVGHPLRKDFAKRGRSTGDGAKQSVRSSRIDSKSALRVGPDHPITRGAAVFDVELAGERIEAVEIELGYAHRGFEKECESVGWAEVVPYTERLNYNSGVLANTAYCLTVEKLLGVRCPPRADWLRVLAGELARVSDHLARCGRVASQLGADAAASRVRDAREFIFDALESLSGARLLPSYVRIGGVCRDLPDDFAARWPQRCDSLRRLLDAYETLANRNPIFAGRLQGSGVLSREDCIRYSVTGPILRAAGEAWDLRKQTPYLVYSDLEFDVPVGSLGDNLDRLLVCLEEIRQSLGIVGQCLEVLESLGPGPIDVAKGELVGFSEDDPAGSGSTRLALPAGDVYFALESANGELGFYLVSDGSDTPCKVRCRPPSFLNLQPLPRMVETGILADLGPTYALLNAIDGECDR